MLAHNAAKVWKIFLLSLRVNLIFVTVFKLKTICKENLKLKNKIKK